MRLQVADPASTDELLARRRANLGCWMTRPVPGLDPSHPYAAQHVIPRRPATAATRAALHEDGRIIERFRRRLPRTCWRVPPKWFGPDVDPEPRSPSTTTEARAARARPGLICRL